MSIEGAPLEEKGVETSEGRNEQVDRLITEAMAMLQDEDVEGAKRILSEISAVAQDLELDTDQTNDIAELSDRIEEELDTEGNDEEE